MNGFEGMKNWGEGMGSGWRVVENVGEDLPIEEKVLGLRCSVMGLCVSYKAMRGEYMRLRGR